MKKLSILLSLMLIFAASLAWAAPQKQSNFTDVTKFSKGGKTLEIPALEAKVSVTTDREGVRHIEATNDHDLAVASGYVHCRDRLFQMDQTRRQVDGTEAELMTPFLLEAFDNAGSSGTPIELADPASDPDIIEAVGRLAKWDFSTPTGIPEGYDAKNPDGKRPPGVPTTEAKPFATSSASA